MKKNKRAVTFGRYILITHAHLNTVTTILKEWQYLTIGVIDLSFQFPPKPDHEWQYFFEICDKKIQSPRSQVFSVQERIKMWKAAIEYENLSQRVQITSIRRPEHVPREFNRLFPPEQYDLVFPQSEEELNEFDLLRNEAFPSLLQRPVHFVNPSLTLHMTEINKKVLSGDTWEKYLPVGAFEIFRQLDGARRLTL